MTEYGMLRLVLLNSANYERAEIPLDDSVSIIGPNNAGKTSLINALQFLLISNRNAMDFGAHESSESLRFYFPTNASYILLEVQLESGLYVLGCVGKGMMHEYQYFAYAGSLDVEHFQKGAHLVSEPDLRDHLSTQGRTVQYFARSSDFFDALYGASLGSRKTAALDLRIYRLANPRLKQTFQRILVRTLRLDRLQAQDVKNFLLEIFETEYGDGIDFGAVWERAFRQVNGDRTQYQLCRKMEQRILDMEAGVQERKILRGKITKMRPQIDQALETWESFRHERLQNLEQNQRNLDEGLRVIRQRQEEQIEESLRLKQQVAEIAKQDAEQQQLEAEYALVPNLDVLADIEAQCQKQWVEAQALLHKTQHSNPMRLQQEIQRKLREINQIQHQLAGGDSLLGPKLQALLNPQEMAILNGLVQSQLLDLPADSSGNVETFAKAFQSWLQAQTGETLVFQGLQLARASISKPYQHRSLEDLQNDLKSSSQELELLENEFRVLADHQAQVQKVQALQEALKIATKNREFYQKLMDLSSASPKRKNDKETAEIRLQELERLRSSWDDDLEALQNQRVQLQRERSELERQHQSIHQLRSQRRDLSETMLNLHHQEHLPWFTQQDLDPKDLDQALRQQLEDCKTLEELDRRIRLSLSDLFQNGFTKFQSAETEDDQLRLILNYTDQLDQENEALQRHLRSAVTSVASSLKELERQYTSFGTKLHHFNQLIGKRHLSDLEHFRIEIRETPQLLESIRTILSHSDAIAELDSPSLFDTARAGADSVGDAELDKAKDRLLQYSRSQGKLTLSDLFHLVFDVAKKGHQAQVFDQLDKIGSNGTVLMAKLIAGLALLHQMLDPKHQTSTICYLDEAASLDDANQLSLIATAKDFGFHLLFASPTPQTTVHYCVPINKKGSRNFVSAKHWQIFEPLP
jgi:hypothetical protein